MFPTLRKSLYLRISWVRWGIVVNLLVNAGLWSFVYWQVDPSVEPVPLHASVYFGIDYTAPYWYYFSFPLLGLFLTIAHALVGQRFYRTYPLMAGILLVIPIFVQATAFGAVAFLTRYIT